MHLSEIMDVAVENLSLEHMQFYYFKWGFTRHMMLAYR